MNQPAVNGGFAPQTLFLGLAASSLASGFLQDRRTFCPEFSPVGAPGSAGALFAFRTVGSGVSGPGAFLWKRCLLPSGLRSGRTLVCSGADTNCPHSTGSLLEPVFFHGGAQRSAATALAGWALPEAVFDHSSQVLWWLAGLGALLCAAGLAGQLHWQNLFPASYRFTGADFGQILYPEYFALTFLCPQRQWRKAVWMPLGSFGVQARSALEWRFYLAHGRGAACPAMSCCVPGHWGPFPGSTRFFCFSGWPQCSSASVCWPTSSGCSGRSSAAEVSVR